VLRLTWLRGWDSDPRPIGYTYPYISKRSGLYHHPDFFRSKALPAFAVLSFEIVSEPFQTFWTWLLITICYHLGFQQFTLCFHAKLLWQAANLLSFDFTQKTGFTANCATAALPRNIVRFELVNSIQKKVFAVNSQNNYNNW